MWGQKGNRREERQRGNELMEALFFRKRGGFLERPLFLKRESERGQSRGRETEQGEGGRMGVTPFFFGAANQERGWERVKKRYA